MRAKGSNLVYEESIMPFGQKAFARAERFEMDAMQPPNLTNKISQVNALLAKNSPRFRGLHYTILSFLVILTGVLCITVLGPYTCLDSRPQRFVNGQFITVEIAFTVPLIFMVSAIETALLISALGAYYSVYKESIASAFLPPDCALFTDWMFRCFHLKVGLIGGLRDSLNKSRTKYELRIYFKDPEPGMNAMTLSSKNNNTMNSFRTTRSATLNNSSLIIHATRFIFGSGWSTVADSSSDSGMSATLSVTDDLVVTASIKNVHVGWYRPVWRVQVVGDSSNWNSLSGLVFWAGVSSEGDSLLDTQSDTVSVKKLGENVQSIANKGWVLLKTPPINVGTWSKNPSQIYQVKFRLGVDSSFGPPYKGLKVDYVCLSPSDPPPPETSSTTYPPHYPPQQTEPKSPRATSPGGPRAKPNEMPRLKKGNTIAPKALERSDTIQLDQNVILVKSDSNPGIKPRAILSPNQDKLEQRNPFDDPQSRSRGGSINSSSHHSKSPSRQQQQHNRTPSSSTNHSRNPSVSENIRVQQQHSRQDSSNNFGVQQIQASGMTSQPGSTNFPGQLPSRSHSRNNSGGSSLGNGMYSQGGGHSRSGSNGPNYIQK
ncbi:hypothetical protein HK098_005518 [Nowakowskiella sp. JEL0407]|nr:hypothetical protein HK098_005518 [Nowakowskiella sp. JEL0407]